MIYPQSHAIMSDPASLLQSMAANPGACTSIYLDTTEDEKEGFLGLSGGENHHQGLARTHKLSDGSVYFFLSHSMIGGQGKLMQFRYTGPLDNEHVLTTHPLTVAPLEQKLHLLEEHPDDICFLPDVDNLDSGYLFVTEEYDMRRVAVYFWQPMADLKLLGYVTYHFNNIGVVPGDRANVAADLVLTYDGPNFVFIDRYRDEYFLGLCNDHVQECALFKADSKTLFPSDQPGAMNIGAFRRAYPDITYPFPPTGGPSQVKLVRGLLTPGKPDDQWWLLAYRCVPNDKENGDDYVDVYPVKFSPAFEIADQSFSQHIFLRPGDTSFASTGTHYVEPGGRLLISSSYRWAEDEGPGTSGYVSRVDEIPSA
ncbi:MAG: hypothetical protein WBM01_25600 [Mycobacterium sp.]